MMMPSSIFSPFFFIFIPRHLSLSLMKTTTPHYYYYYYYYRNSNSSLAAVVYIWWWHRQHFYISSLTLYTHREEVKSIAGEAIRVA